MKTSHLTSALAVACVLSLPYQTNAACSGSLPGCWRSNNNVLCSDRVTHPNFANCVYIGVANSSYLHSVSSVLDEDPTPYHMPMICCVQFLGASLACPNGQEQCSVTWRYSCGGITETFLQNYSVNVFKPDTNSIALCATYCFLSTGGGVDQCPTNACPPPNVSCVQVRWD